MSATTAHAVLPADGRHHRRDRTRRAMLMALLVLAMVATAAPAHAIQQDGPHRRSAMAVDDGGVPVAHTDHIRLREGPSHEIVVPGSNDEDPDGGGLRVIEVTLAPEGGSAVIHEGGLLHDG